MSNADTGQILVSNRLLGGQGKQSRLRASLLATVAFSAVVLAAGAGQPVWADSLGCTALPGRLPTGANPKGGAGGPVSGGSASGGVYCAPGSNGTASSGGGGGANQAGGVGGGAGGSDGLVPGNSFDALTSYSGTNGSGGSTATYYGYGGGGGGAGGFGAVLTGLGSIISSGSLTGGNGGLGGDGGPSFEGPGNGGSGGAGGDGGIGLFLSGVPTFTASGFVKGGNGGAGGQVSNGGTTGNGGDGSAGIVSTGTGVLNIIGSVTGGQAGLAGELNIERPGTRGADGKSGIGVIMVGAGTLVVGDSDGTAATVLGGAGTASTNAQGPATGIAGGTGVLLNAGGFVTVQAGSSIGGGNGGAAGNFDGVAHSATGGAGGIGLIASAGGTINIFGIIQGGNGGNSQQTSGPIFVGATGGAGISATGATITNSGTIRGGAGGTADSDQLVGQGVGGQGGIGISGSDLTIINSGTISKGTESDGYLGVTAAVLNGTTPAIKFTGGTNSLELQAGSVISGNVVAVEGGNDTLRLGGAVSPSAVFDVSKINNKGSLDTTGGVGNPGQYQYFANFEKDGFSRWELTGATTVQTAWNIKAGTLAISADSNLGDTTNSPGIVTLSGGRLETTADITTSRAIVLGKSGLNSSRINTAGGTTLTLNGGISGDGKGATTTSSFTKDGAGTLVLGAASNYTGVTSVNDGILKGGATGAFASGSTFTLSRGTTLDVGGFNQTIGGINNGAGSTINNTGTAAASLTVSGTGASSFAGNVQDGNSTLGLTLSGGGRLQLKGANNTYSGDTNVIEVSTLQSGAVNAFSANSAHVIGARSILDLNSFSQTIGSLAGAGTVNAWAQSEGAGPLVTLTTGGNNNSTTFSGMLRDGNTGPNPVPLALVKTGSGTFTLAGANDYSGGTTLSDGTLAVSSDENLGKTGTTVTIGKAKLRTTADITTNRNILFAAADGAAVLTDSGTLLTLTGKLGALTSAAPSSNGFTKNGFGTLVLQGQANYTGGTQVLGGTLKGGAANAFAPQSAVFLDNNATLDLGGFDQTIAGLDANGAIKKYGQPASQYASPKQNALAIVTTTGTGNSMLTLATSESSSYDFGGVIKDSSSGTISLTKTGNGTQTLSGASTYSGATNVKSGTLQAGGDNVLSANSAYVLSQTPGTTSLLDLNGYSQTIGSLAGGGNVVAANFEPKSIATVTLTTGGNNTSTNFTGLLADNFFSSSSSLALALTKTGTGTLTLSGTSNNTYSGGTIVQSGTLAFTNSHALGTGDVTLKSGATLQFAAQGLVLANNIILATTLDPVIDTMGNNVTEAGVISGAGFLTKQGSGTLTLTGLNTYTGATQIDAGSLKAGVAGAFSPFSTMILGSGTVLDLGGFDQTAVSLNGTGTVTDNGANATLTLTNASGSFGGTIMDGSGKTGFAITGGTLGLSGSNTYSGPTLVQGATLRGDAATTFSANSAFTIANAGATNGILDLNGNSQTIGSLAGNGTVTGASLGEGLGIPARLTTGGNNTSTVFSGQVTDGAGALALVKTGTGTMVLSGVNTYSGGTTVNGGGKLSVSASYNLGAAAAGVTLDNGTLQSTATFNTARQFTLTNLGGTFLTDAATTLTLNGGISGPGFGGGVTKDGAGTLLLAMTGMSNYVGSTFVKGGTLAAGAINAFAPRSGISVQAGATLDLGGFNQTIAGLNGGFNRTGIVTTNGGDATLTLSLGGGFRASNASLQDGTGKLSLTVTGETQQFFGRSTYSGTTLVTAGGIQGGAENALSANSAFTLTKAPLFIGSTPVPTATLDLNLFNQTIGSLAGNGTVTNGEFSEGPFPLATLTTGGNNTSTTFTGLLKDGDPNLGGKLALTKTGTGTFTLTNANTYTGGTTIQSGTLAFSNNGAFGSGDISLKTGGTLQFAANGLVLANNIVLATTLDPVIDTMGNNGTEVGIISGAGLLTKQGTGILTLAAQNTYTGATNVAQGTLQGGVANAFSAASAVSVSGGATLDIGGFAQTIASLGGQSTAIVTNNGAAAATLTTGGDGTNTTYSGILQNGNAPLAVVKVGPGVTTLAGNATYTGATSINGGTVRGGADNALAAASATTIAANATLDLGGFAQKVNSVALNGGTLQNGALTGAVTSTGGAINGLGGQVSLAISTGTTVLSGSNTYSGSTTINGGTLQAGNANAFSATSFTSVNTGAVLDLGGFVQTINLVALAGGTVRNGSLVGSLSSAGIAINGLGGSTGVTTTAGTTVISGINNYSGKTTVQAGILRGAAANSFSAGSLTSINTGATVDLGGFSQTINNVAISGGTLQNGLLAGAVTSSGGALVAIGGTANLTTTGGVTLLSGVNAYTGTTSINGGTLKAAATNSLSAASSTSISTGGTLDLGGFAQTVNSVALNGGTLQNGALTGAVTSTGGTISAISGPAGVAISAGTTTLAATTYTGATNVTGGTLRGGALNAFSPNSVLTSAASATIDLNGFGQTVPALSGAGTLTNSGSATASLALGGNDGFTTYAGLVRDGAGKTGITKSGTGTFTLSGANTYSGGTIIQNGTVAAGSNTALGTGLITLKTGGTLLFAANNLTLANNIVLPGTLDPTIDTGANNATEAGVISGTGALSKLGTGTLTLTGNSTLTGPTSLGAGALVVNGSLASSTVTVNSGTSLAGSGTVGGLVVASGGVLAPGLATPYSTLAVNGNVTFQSGSIFNVGITAAGQKDMIAGTGSATIAGGTVNVAAATGVYNPASTYTLQTAAGGVTGRFTTLNTNLAFLTPALTYNATSVVLGFATATERLPGADPQQTTAFPTLAITPNQFASAAGLQSLGAGNVVYSAILSQTADQARRSFDAASGEAHASAAGAAIEDSRFVREAVLNRLYHASRDEALAPSAPARAIISKDGGSRVLAPLPTLYAFWGQGLGDWGRNKGNSNAATLDRRLGGLILGADAHVYGPWRAGIVGGYTSDGIKVAGRSSSGTVQSYYGAAYAGASFNALNVRAGVAYAGIRTKTSRNIVFANFADFATTSYNGSLYQGFGEVGYKIAFGNGVIEPMLGAAAIHLDQGSFREAGGAASLAGFSRSTDVQTTTVGVRAEYSPIANVPFTLRGLLGWRHAFGDVSPKARLAFASGSTAFTVTGAPVAQDAAMVEMLADWKATGNISLGVSYSGQLSTSVQDHAFKGNFVYKF